MGAEKATVFAQSWNAMAMQAFVAQQELAASFMRSFWSPRASTASAVAAQWQNAALSVMAKGLAPVHRKTVSNAKRLARTRLF